MCKANGIRYAALGNLVARAVVLLAGTAYIWGALASETIVPKVETTLRVGILETVGRLSSAETFLPTIAYLRKRLADDGISL